MNDYLRRKNGVACIPISVNNITFKFDGIGASTGESREDDIIISDVNLPFQSAINTLAYKIRQPIIKGRIISNPKTILFVMNIREIVGTRVGLIHPQLAVSISKVELQYPGGIEIIYII